MPSAAAPGSAHWPHVVIVGGGFGGLATFHLSGFVAWLLWGVIHVWFLVGFRNRVVVMINWLWAYITFERGARLITGRED